MPRTLCVANQKGGVGKTTTAVNVAAGLARAGRRTLLVDLDPQCNATTGLGLETGARHPLVVAKPLCESWHRTYQTELILLPGCRRFDDIEALAHRRDHADIASRLSEVGKEFDYVLIDCPPSLGGLTEAALLASDEVLMPIQCEYFAMEGLTQMIEIIRGVMRRPEKKLAFAGILLTMVDASLELSREVDEEVRDFFGEVVFQTVIPRDVAVAEAPSHGQAVIDYSPRALGARAYIELCMEVMEK